MTPLKHKKLIFFFFMYDKVENCRQLHLQKNLV